MHLWSSMGLTPTISLLRLSLTYQRAPSQLILPPFFTRRVSSSGGYSSGGMIAGKGRGDGSYTAAGGRCPRASWGLSRLYSPRNLSKADCWAFIFARGGRAVSAFNVRCIRSGRMPRRIHQMAKNERPAGALDENGAPLSVRIENGSPNSRKANSKTGFASDSRVRLSPSHLRRYRLKPSEMVSG